MFREIIKALREILGDPARAIWALVLSLLIFWVIIMIPVWTTPGNDFLFQLSLLDLPFLILMITLSVSNGILLVMQVYVQKAKWRMKKQSLGLQGAASVGSILLSVMSAAIACTACYSSIIALFGLGASSFVFKYRYAMAIGAIVLALFALWQTAKAVNGSCEVCSIKLPTEKL